jgi:hypothetical protein
LSVVHAAVSGTTPWHDQLRAIRAAARQFLGFGSADLVFAGFAAGTTSSTPYNHYALLCSIENAFGLDHLGLAAQPGLGCFGKDVYNR